MASRVAPRSLVWRLHPNGGRVACVAVPADEAPRLIERGWITIEGERAEIAGELPNAETHNVALRITFDRPYPYPHP